MRTKLIAVLSAAILCLCGISGITAHAQSKETITVTPSPSASRTISTEGAGHVVDNISDGENLQFISVTAKDGSVFFIVIDKQNTNDNVYFMNKVDIADLEALAKDNNLNTQTAAKATPTPSATPETAQKDKPAEKKQSDEKKDGGINSGVIVVILLLAAAGLGGGYYFKVILPKKKLEDADDLEDFDFEDENINDDTDAGVYDEETDDTEDEE